MVYDRNIDEKFDEKFDENEISIWLEEVLKLSNTCLMIQN